MMMCFIKGFAKILENTLLLTLKRLGFKSIFRIRNQVR